MFFLRLVRCTIHRNCHAKPSERPKVVRTCSVLNILTSTCAWRHNGVHFFDISSGKSGLNMGCFVHFDFAPQRRALFWHHNFQKWSDTEVFYTFWLRNMLRATTACTFSTFYIFHPFCLISQFFYSIHSIYSLYSINKPSILCSLSILSIICFASSISSIHSIHSIYSIYSI